MHEAKAKLTQIVSAAEKGEAVIITKHGRRAVRLVPVGRAGGYYFSADDSDRALLGLDGPSLHVSESVDDGELSHKVLGLTE